jgi:hypothetical protein
MIDVATPLTVACCSSETFQILLLGYAFVHARLMIVNLNCPTTPSPHQAMCPCMTVHNAIGD